MTRIVDPRTVTSTGNAAVKRARALERDRTLRERQGLYLAWGLHLAQEALSTGAPVRQAFVGTRLQESQEGRNLLRDLGAAAIPILRTTTRILDSVVEGSGDQGVLLLCGRPRHALSHLLGRQASLVLAAQGVQDPGNLGSILRSALALGASGLVALPGCTDPFGSRAVRAAMGAQFTLAVAAADIPEFLERARESRFQIVAADPGGANTPPEVDLTPPTVLLVGSEGGGLPEALLEAARHRVRVPMKPGAESLNVHAASVALLYETARQRGFRHEAGPAPGS
ncbi:MAG TPA: RNA methyltransferase [Candidatus Polarisedimenticolia bacterium]|nr:RNA methyltransferase [Candidatus Polarisedimenticolia bacterium]